MFNAKINLSRSSAIIIRETLLSLVQVAIILISIFPLYWMALTSLKPGIDVFSNPPIWIFKPTVEHYINVFKEEQIGNIMFNSTSVALSDTILAVSLGCMAAYSLSRFVIPRKKDLWFWIISNRMIPPAVLAVPVFLIANNLGLLDTRRLLALLYLSFNLPLVILIMIVFFNAVPKDLDEAAMVDGCTVWGAFWRVALPLTLPGLAVAAIFTFIFSWNEFLFALVLTESNARTLPVAAAAFQSDLGIRWGEISAAGMCIVVPVLVFAIVVSRYLVRGLTLGAVK
jgi:multiple sugar transport system permease protein